LQITEFQACNINLPPSLHPGPPHCRFTLHSEWMVLGWRFTQWYSTCIACLGPWVRSRAPWEKERRSFKIEIWPMHLLDKVIQWFLLWVGQVLTLEGLAHKAWVMLICALPSLVGF
jgi:hypothetical protein